ncbi:helix-turn-helix domain-containing protein [Microbacterium foliorum]|uniref:helix-turn-helix domain-containing protein n=1 Tax=Microbacterium foliorum TaxID=104336 RepID=UPI001D67E245|nr:helix-turn-helix domain-containing protein [Microbacterium foliorum]CAH0169970.1 hypothetical protein SRABI03_01223 [Microbacterium foliorum]CAH0193362.1 hypothetical protein SRABI44_01743 [Microbacterium foliorum]
MLDPTFHGHQVDARRRGEIQTHPVKLTKFRAFGREALLNAKPERAHSSPTNIRFTQVEDENAAVWANLVRIRRYMFAHVKLPAATLMWSRDALSQHQVVMVATESPGLQVASDAPIVERRPTWFVVPPGRTPVRFTASRPLEVVFVSLDRSAVEDELDIDPHRAGQDDLDDAVLRPMVNFVKSLCAIQGESVETGASPLGGAACEVARSLVKTVVGDPLPEISLADAVFDILRRDYASSPLTPSAVARTMGVSARTIQSALRREGTTFSATLRSIRLEAAKDLQRRNAEMNATAVARAVGFGSRQALYRSMRDAGKKSGKR